MRYPVELIDEDNGTVAAVVPDIPGAHSFGDDAGEALVRVVDAIETMLMALMADREDIPEPSPADGHPTVALPALTTAKIGLYRAMREAGVGKAELARRLGWHLPQVDRALDLKHASRLDMIEAALGSLGKQLNVEVEEAA
jgi:antitoxin HicB